jgi:hypothetical protein
MFSRRDHKLFWSLPWLDGEFIADDDVFKSLSDISVLYHFYDLYLI